MAGNRNGKPLKKQLEKKKFADLAVQGTNNSSIASKRSVELLYLPKLGVGSRALALEPGRDYFKYFIPKKVKRSPCINRGYWLRLHAIRTRLESILEQCPNKATIINLGCGYDPLPLEMLDSRNPQFAQYSGRLDFIDIDYEDLLTNKVEMLRDSEELQQIIGEELSPDTIQITTPHYKTRACDLYDTNQFEKLLKENHLDDPSVIKIFIAEVSLAYMKHDKANDIIKSCSKFENSHVIVLEQIIPEGRHEPFSGRMLKHFTKNESPLQTVLFYPTIQSQIQRFKDLGFNTVNAGDMFQLWKSLPYRVHEAIDKIEPFDELEEFHLFCHHYMLCHATNNNSFKFLEPYIFSESSKLDEISTDNEYSMKQVDFRLNKRFMSGFVDKTGSVLLNGGSNPYRTNETVQVNINEKINEILNTGENPEGRLCHNFISVSNGNYYISIGGRKAPHQPLNEIWVYDTNNVKWKRGPDLDQYRFRLCTCKIDESTLLLYGGNKTLMNAFIQLTIDDAGTVLLREVQAEASESIVGGSAYYNTENDNMVVMGGSNNGSNVKDEMYIYSYDRTNLSLKIIKKIKNDYLKRYGCKILHLSGNEYLVAGGTSPDRLFNMNSSIIKIDTDTEHITSINIPAEIWKKDELMLVGFELLKLPNGSVCIIGGGATCYGFGSVSNGTYIISK
ncbi:tRNA wybutosine-synthesizing protein 4 [Nakaseomyces bracarensis]|uniref:tRNA wybutosine-synthesizing protein 4 n=1 Tax=Nakaseomyces bracarensis TaxID=273131 RepID=A0ABR4NWH0_9SACH